MIQFFELTHPPDEINEEKCDEIVLKSEGLKIKYTEILEEINSSLIGHKRHEFEYKKIYMKDVFGVFSSKHINVNTPIL